MSTETTPAITPSTPTSPAAPQAPNADQAVESAGEVTDDVISFLNEELGKPHEPDVGSVEDTPKPPDAEVEAKPAETPKVEEKTPEPTLDDRIKQLAEKSFAEREAKREQERVAAEHQRQMDEIKAERARLQAWSDAVMRDPIEAIKQAGHNPRVIFDRMLEAAKDPQAWQAQQQQSKTQTAAEARLEALEKQLAAQQQQQEAAQQQSRAAEEFERAKVQLNATVSAKADKYPLLSKLDESSRLRRAQAVAVQLRASGVEGFDFDDVAEYAEAELRDLAAVFGHQSTAAPTQSAAQQPNVSSGQRQPTTISAAQTTERAAIPDLDSEEGRMAEAIRYLEEAKRSQA